MVIASPLIIVTLIPFILISHWLNIPLSLPHILLGAAGWWIALVLRVPFILVSQKLPITTTQKQSLIISLSGPTEEIVRFLVLLLLGFTTSNAFSVGIGWAAIEIFYSIIQGIAMGTLAQRTDEKAVQAKALLQAQGMDKSMKVSAPFWGILERLSANALHISFSLLLIISPLFVIVSIPLHSLLNLTLTRLIKDSFIKAELTLAVLSLSLFATVVFCL